MPDRASILKSLTEHIQNDILLRDDPLATDEDLFEAGFDSMSLSRVLVFVEEEFGVTIPDHEVVIEEVSTLDKLSAFVTEWVQKSDA